MRIFDGQKSSPPTLLRAFVDYFHSGQVRKRPHLIRLWEENARGPEWGLEGIQESCVSPVGPPGQRHGQINDAYILFPPMRFSLPQVRQEAHSEQPSITTLLNPPNLPHSQAARSSHQITSDITKKEGGAPHQVTVAPFNLNPWMWVAHLAPRSRTSWCVLLHPRGRIM